MKGKLFSLFMLALLIGFNACQQESMKEIELDAAQKALLKGAESDWVYVDANEFYFTYANMSVEFCGEKMYFPFYSSADVDVFNDGEFLYVKVGGIDGWVINYLSVNIWSAAGTDIYAGDYESYPYQIDFDKAPVAIFKIPYNEEWGVCFKLAIKVYANRYNDDGSIEFKWWWVTADNILYGINYELDFCWKDCDYECEPFRTQTPGGWGAPASGNNPGMYRDLNFDNAFPNGLVVGGDYTLTLTSAAAVEAFLPSGGKPLPLMQDYIDPNSKTLKNTFAGHVVALTLSTVFDAYDENFSAANEDLGDLIIADGSVFDGMTVQDILDEANVVLGGGASSYSVSQLSELLTKINEYYVDGEWTGDGSLFDDCWNYEVE
ncbi:hypothetical protein [Carboxylicivirga caseinilyticus]|uniref:hypothetical protein n=1 Tax=Carboxylicivirga caseinilyticus TaxID=3417572 RepID=UPI003D35406A|nr:hypothetical protein [Marinilabiliaceae bacterium A049]